nr:MAG TPA: Hemocyanin, copper containing domain [Caudoviricetes sp.]
MLVFHRGLLARYYAECYVMVNATYGELHSLPSP